MSSNPLLDRILKNSPTKNASVLSKSIFFQNRDVIPTDLPILNIAFSGSPIGGLASGLTIFAGASKSFKSLLGLFCLKAYLDKYDDAIAVFYDSEGGITPEYLKANGIDPSRVIHVPIEHLEMLKFDLVKTLKELERKDHVVIMIDSLGNTASLKELEDAENEKSVAEMQRAKTMKGLFRMVTPALIAKDVPCIAVAHTYQTMEIYSKSIISGGCLIAGTKIQMADNTLKEIQDVNKGDLVKTLDGDKAVTNTWDPDTLEEGKPNCYKITFKDGYSITCSDKHKFLLYKNYAENWVSAKHLFTDDIVTTYADLPLEIESIEYVGPKPVYDISVDFAEHYILENGVVSHNSGIMYASNQAFIISKAQEKEGTDLAGWKFTINIEKSRYVREKSKLPFTVLYDSGIQKWSGLFDLAVDAGFILKPKQGWYQLVNPTTGEVSEKNYREKDIMKNDQFFSELIKDTKFIEYVENRFKLIAHFNNSSFEELNDILPEEFQENE